MRIPLQDWHLVAGGAIFAVVLGASFPRPVLNEPDQPVWRAKYGQSSYSSASYALVNSGPVEAIPGPIWDARGYLPGYDPRPAVFVKPWPQVVPAAEADLPNVPTARELAGNEAQAQSRVVPDEAESISGADTAEASQRPDVTSVDGPEVQPPPPDVLS